MDFFYTLGSYFRSILPLGFWDVVDITVLTILIYKVVSLVKETRAGGLIKGIIVVGAAYIVMNYIVENHDGMKAMSYLVGSVLDIGLLALVVLFQPELRRMLEKMGHSRMSKITALPFSFESSEVRGARWIPVIETLCDACEGLSLTSTGAIIVIEQYSKLGEQIDTGTLVNALPSKELLGNIFYPKTPLHDGAVIVRDGLVLAAGCFLPNSQKEETINKALGARHRAAIGMSEISDAIVIVVSEETGNISVAENGVLTRSFTRDSLKKLLRSRLLQEKPQKQPKTMRLKQSISKKEPRKKDK
ncbi:MAG: diadenylate cyclase CdaA [Oscillospiraceae bacterium]|nr:diadenylate cyclase CdaA [Oscillospiraceae bacterium]